MAEANDSARHGNGRKHHVLEGNTYDQRDRKRLRQGSAEGLPLRSDGPIIHRPEKTPMLESPDSQFPIPHLHHSPAAESIHTIPLIDLTNDDDEDIVFESAREEPPARDSRGRDFSATKQDIGTTSLAPMPGLNEIYSVPYDTCFGLVGGYSKLFPQVHFADPMQIQIPSTIGSSLQADSDWFPVKLEPSNKTLKILTLDSRNHVGLACSTSSPTICQLVGRTRVVLTATLVVPDDSRRSQYVRATLRIVLYGFMSEKRTVAKTLSDGDLYLQHPSLSECDGRVPYFNPQYLLRPGGSMPKLEHLMISSQSKSDRVAGDWLAEVEKSRLLQIFESAHDPDATFGIRPSLRLQSVLKEYVAS